MSFVPDTLMASNLDVPTLREAGAQVLSLALMDSRNHSLHVASRIHASLAACADGSRAVVAREALLELLRSHGLRIAQWTNSSWAKANVQSPSNWEGLQAQLLLGSEAMQERLLDAEPHAQALAPFRASLELEDRLGHSLIRIAHTWANAWAEAAGSRAEDAAQVWGTDWPAPHAHAARQSLWMPSRQWALGASARQRLGTAPNAFAWHDELHHVVQHVPEFDIDAQPVTWAQFVEFVDDDGYDRTELWSAPGWEWVQRCGRRAPQFVEQLGVASGAVLQRSFGRLTRRVGTHACMHLSWFEADAYARWAGRRLPTEHEWEIAATLGTGQGFRWGDVLEWTLERYAEQPLRQGEYTPRQSRPLPSDPARAHRSVRGASFATRQRNRIAPVRFHAAPHRDDGFFGFRTCSL